MLAEKYRFHGHGSLRYLYKNSQAVRREYLTLKYVANKRRSVPRVAVVVSKKVCKSAVDRNRIRRRLYELIRRELPKLQQSLDMVLIVSSRELVDIEAIELAELVADMLNQAKLYKTTP